MQIKKFEAANMTEALRLVKKEFGSDAVILSAQSLRNDKGLFSFSKKPRVVITAATDSTYSEPLQNNYFQRGTYDMGRSDRSYVDDVTNRKTFLKHYPEEMTNVIQSGNISLERPKKRSDTRVLFTLYHQMLDQEISEDAALKLTGEINRLLSSAPVSRQENMQTCLAYAFEERGITASRVKFEKGKQKIIALVGPTGVGKTTTVAKLATAAISGPRKKEVGLITLDNSRIGAIAQLKVYANIIGAPLEVATNKKELKEAFIKLRDKDFILIDTPGINPKNMEKLHQLNALFDKSTQVEFHLLLSATTKEKDLTNSFEGFKIMHINRLIFTKMDESSTYGSLLNQLFKTQVPVSYFTNGQDLTEDIEVATIEKLALMILEQEKKENLLTGPPEVLAETMISFENMLENAIAQVSEKQATFENQGNNAIFSSFYRRSQGINENRYSQ